jgi:hypothetical protein
VALDGGDRRARPGTTLASCRATEPGSAGRWRRAAGGTRPTGPGEPRSVSRASAARRERTCRASLEPDVPASARPGSRECHPRRLAGPRSIRRTCPGCSVRPTACHRGNSGRKGSRWPDRLPGHGGREDPQQAGAGVAAEVLEVLIIRCGDGDLVVKTQPGGGTLDGDHPGRRSRACSGGRSSRPFGPRHAGNPCRPAAPVRPRLGTSCVRRLRAPWPSTSVPAPLSGVEARRGACTARRSPSCTSGTARVRWHGGLAASGASGPVMDAGPRGMQHEWMHR